MRWSRKPVYVSAYRGFESHPVRFKSLEIQTDPEALLMAAGVIDTRTGNPPSGRVGRSATGEGLPNVQSQ